MKPWSHVIMNSSTVVPPGRDTALERRCPHHDAMASWEHEIMTL